MVFCDHHIKYKNLCTAVCYNTTLCNLALTCLCSLILHQDMSKSPFSYLELLIHRGPNSLPLCIWMFCSSHWNNLPSLQLFTWLTPPSSRITSDSCSLVTSCFCPYCSRCFKYLPFPHIHLDTTTNQTWPLLREFLNPLWVLRECYGCLSCSIYSCYDDPLIVVCP